ncbi:MAG TPA: hypothetical protein VM925_21720, partial [Labilithrix sp.]|nr:hypothetical protein [Labilithrix sp.]
MTRNVLGTIAGVGVLLTASVAMAQPTDTPPATTQPGDTNATPLPPPRPAPATATVTTTTEASTAKKDDGLTDHERVIKKFGVMYFGVSQQPIAQGAPTGLTRQTVSTPVIGVRYWLMERLGIDAGLGFNFSRSSSTVQPPRTGETTTDGPAVLSFAVHGGLPLAFAYGKHYKFLLVPELNLGYATRTDAVVQNAPPGTVVPPDIHRSGFRFDVGARVGTEIQFGFIGIPELALQASVGLNFRHQVWSASQDAGPGVLGESSASQSASGIGTTVQA